MDTSGKEKYKLNFAFFENWQFILFCIISIVFTVLYAKFIFSPSNEMLGSSTTDGFQSLTILNTNYQILQSGHIPFGAFWLPDFYGGAVATYFHVSVIPEISHTALLIIGKLTTDLVLSLKIFAILFLVIAQFLSYKFAKFYFKNNGIAWIFSIGYSFSTFYMSQLNGGHYNFIATIAILPGVLLLFEKMFINPTTKNMAVSSASLILLFFGDLQITIFAAYYLILRIAYYVITRKSQIRILLIRVIECLTLFTLAIAPFLLSFIILQNTSALSVPYIPTSYLTDMSQLLTRSIGGESLSGNTIMYSLYIGVILFGFSVIPIWLAKAQKKDDRQNYIFYSVTFIFFSLIAVGTALSTLVTSLFVRVPSRDVIFIVLSMCMCAGYGLLHLSAYLRNNSFRIQKLAKNKILTTIVIVCVASFVYLDLTWGMHPITLHTPKLTGGELFIQSQSEDFRVLKYPIVWAYSNYESTIIKHEIIGVSPIAIRQYPPDSELFLRLSNNFDTLHKKTDNSLSGNFTLLSTICGVKYVLIEKNQNFSDKYINFFENSTAYFSLAYQDQDSAVYENIYFKGTIFSIKNQDQPILLKNITIQDLVDCTLNNSITYKRSFNRLELSLNVSEPQYVVLSQSYHPSWVITNDGKNSPQYIKLLNVTGLQLEIGTYNLTANFAVSDQANLLYLVVYIPLFFICLIIYADSKNKKNLLKVTLSILLIIGATILSLSLLENTNSAFKLAEFGPFNKAVLGIGIMTTLIAFFGFTKKRVMTRIDQLWLHLRKMFSYIIKRIKKSSLTIKTWSYCQAITAKEKNNKLPKTLLLITIVIVALANINPLFEYTSSWLKECLLFNLLLIIGIYTVKTDSDINLPKGLMLSESSKEKSNKHNWNIRHPHLGVFGGLLGVFTAGLILRAIALYTNEFVSMSLILCGSFGGVGFGALTSGNKRLRGLFACAFGIIAIIFGLMMIYTTPIVVGYSLTNITNEGYMPFYKWQQFEFSLFLKMEFLKLSSLYYAFIGLLFAYLAGSNLALRKKKLQK